MLTEDETRKLSIAEMGRLVRRLRRQAKRYDDPNRAYVNPATAEMLNSAADTIDRFRATKAALERLSKLIERNTAQSAKEQG